MDTPELPDGTRQGTNSYGNIGYNGSCPQRGIIVCSQEGVRGTAKSREYHFVLYALDTQLDLATGITQAELHNAMKGHILIQAETMGKFMAPPKLDNAYSEFVVPLKTPSTQTSK